MFRPHIPDRAGRGALCALIEALAKDLMALRAHPEYPSRAVRDEYQRVERRLDQARRSLLTLYGKGANDGVREG